MEMRKRVEEAARDDDAQAALMEALEQDAGAAETDAETDAEMDAEAVEAEAADGGAEGSADGEAEVYRTQKEIDAAMGRRLRREREKWEKKHARALLLEETLGEGGIEEAVAAVLAQRHGVDAGDLLAAMPQVSDPRALAEAARAAALEREAQALRGEDPAFDLEAAMGNPAFRALVEAGEPLERAHAYITMDKRAERLREEARLEMLRAIRARGGRPAALRAQGGYAGADVSGMSDAAMRAIDERLKRGERVRL